MFTSQLSRSLGFRGTVLLFANYYATIAILRAVTPAFGRLAAVEARLEGEYRAGMGRIGREAEEIAYALFLDSHIQSDTYIKVLQWWRAGERLFDESVPQVDQTRQLDLQGAHLSFAMEIRLKFYMTDSDSI